MFFRILARVFFWVFGVLTCAFYAVETEWVCLQTSYLWALFAPLLIIPLANAAVLLTDLWKSPGPRLITILGTLNGIALIVAIFLALALSPLWLLALMGLLFSFIPCFLSIVGGRGEAFGTWWMVLFYFFVATGPLMTVLDQRGKLKRLLPTTAKPRWWPLSTCAAVTISAILVAVFPITLTQTCSADIFDGARREPGLLLLRAVGDDNELLRACYSDELSVPWFFQVLSLFHHFPLAFDDSATTDRIQALSREIYYRVKGRPFNSVPRPFARRQSGVGDDWQFLTGSKLTSDNDDDDDRGYYNGYNYDSDFAGEAVGGVVRGLSLAKSSLSGWADANDAVAHLSWRMRFHGAGKQKELRAQILLPPHAVITGCSLAINGVKHDAVFATRNSSRRAYQTAAVKGEKPLLVSTAGAGRVLVQSSTGWWSSDADLTLDITTPLVILERDKAALPLPMFTERNFDVPVNHEISLTCAKPEYSGGFIAGPIPSQFNETQVTGSISNKDLSSGGGAIILQRDPSANRLIAQDPADSKHDLLQKIEIEKLSPTTPLILVVDGSSTMSDQTGRICDALKNIHFSDATIVWASDVPQVVIANADTASPTWTTALARLRDSSCLGGQNNAEALSLAIKHLGGAQAATIVWLHGPQPVAFSGDTLLPELTKASNKLKLYEYQMVTGPNEVIKSLDQCSALVQVPRLATTQKDLDALFSRLSGQHDALNITRQYIDSGSTAAPSTKHAWEIAQLNANDLVFSNLTNLAERVKYGTLAENHKIVTPLTSAVVLEQQADYKQYGVTKHSEKTSKTETTFKGPAQLAGFSGFIPAKPEPPLFLLMCCAFPMIMVVLWIKRRRRELARL